jgi:hypothetical protein
MKSLTIYTLVVAMAVGAIPLIAAAGEVPNLLVNRSETNSHKATASTSTVALHALNRLDAQTLAEEEMTDQELEAVEGGTSMTEYIIDPVIMALFAVIKLAL